MSWPPCDGCKHGAAFHVTRCRSFYAKGRLDRREGEYLGPCHKGECKCGFYHLPLPSPSELREQVKLAYPTKVLRRK